VVTKAEQVAELRKLGVDVNGSDYTQAELQGLIDAENARAVLPGDAVTYTLTAEHAAALSYREAKFARFVKGVAPFEPRTYTEGDAMYGRVFSSYDDGTATLDLFGSFPRFTLERVAQGDGIGQFRIKE
jgi:hypothetical protein